MTAAEVRRPARWTNALVHLAVKLDRYLARLALNKQGLQLEQGVDPSHETYFFYEVAESVPSAAAWFRLLDVHKQDPVSALA